MNKIVDFTLIDTDKTFGNFKKSENINTNIRSYTLNTQNGNKLMETSYPGIIKTMIENGSSNDIVALFSMGDVYLGSIKLRKKQLVSRVSNTLSIMEIEDFEERVDDNESPNFVILLKLLMPLLDISQSTKNDPVSFVNLMEVMKPFLDLVIKNHENGETISNYFTKLFGRANRELNENLEKIDLNELLLMSTWLIEACTGKLVLDIVYEGKKETPVIHIVNPTPFKMEDFVVRFWDLTLIEDQAGRNFYYLM
jgi:hypothetical protein